MKLIESLLLKTEITSFIGFLLVVSHHSLSNKSINHYLLILLGLSASMLALYFIKTPQIKDRFISSAFGFSVGLCVGLMSINFIGSLSYIATIVISFSSALLFSRLLNKKQVN